MLKLNLGCGANPIEGFHNIDLHNKDVDEQRDIRLGLSQENESVDGVVFFHCIEHIEKKHHRRILLEILRVLKPGGFFYISYPAFDRCVAHFLGNTRGKRDFWEATIFGRQSHPGDYHYCAVTDDYMRNLLLLFGFKDLEVGPEPNEEYNTVIRCLRPNRILSPEEVLREEIYAGT